MRKLVQGIGMLLLPASLCFGNLVLQTQAQFQGQGLGAVATVLTLQGNGNASDPANNNLEGCVGRSSGGGSDVTGISLNGSGACISGTNSDVQNGQTQTVLVSDAKLNFTSAADLVNNFAVVYNSNQTNVSPIITLQQLALTIYAANGTPLFTTGTAGVPLTLDPLAQGIGGANYVFQLDSTQKTTLLGILSAPGVFTSSLRFGAYALAGCTGTESYTCYPQNDGPETVNIARVTGVSSVPEPGTWMLMTASLAGLAYRRFKASRS